MSDDLVTWLRQQLDEDERWAKLAAHQAGSTTWEPEEGTGTTVVSRVRIGPGRFFESLGEEGFASEHIARHDPARVLADVAAKRAILELHGKASPPGWSSPEHRRVFGSWCPRCVAEELPYDQGVEYEPWPCSTLRLLALPYADRAGYRDEWRPA